LADGKLTFDTKIDESGFDKDLDKIVNAINRVTKAVNRVGATIEKAFNLKDTGIESETKNIEKSLEDTTKATENASKATEDFEAQWEKIVAMHPEWKEQEIPVTEEDVKEVESNVEKVVDAVNKVNETKPQDAKPMEQVAESAQEATKELSETGRMVEFIKNTFLDIPNIFSHIKNSIKDAFSSKEAEKEIYTIQQRVDACREHLMTLEGQGLSFGDSEYDKTYSELAGLMNELNEYKARLAEAGVAENQHASQSSRSSKVMSILKNAMHGVVSVIGLLGRGIATVAIKMAGLAGKALSAGKGLLGMINPLKRIGSESNKSGGMISSFGNRIIRMAKTAFIFGIFRKGFTELRKYLGGMLKTNAEFYNSLAQIKGNLLTAFQPIFEACLPAINALGHGLSYVTGLLAQFTSMLFGKSVKASQEAAKAQYEQVKAYEATGKASKKSKCQQLSDIDELHNRAKQSDENNGGGGNDVTPNFSDIDESSGVSEFTKKLKEAWSTADFTEIGDTVAQKIADALNNIPWTKIQDASSKIGSSISTFINGATGNKDLWQELGKTVAEGINTGIVGVKSLVEKLNFSQIGTALGTALNSLANNINLKDLVTTLTGLINGAMESIKSFINTVDWSGTSAKLGKSIQEIFTGIDWVKVGSTISAGSNAISTSINNFFSNTDFSKVGDGLATGVNNSIKNINWSEKGKSISNIANGIIDTLYGFVTKTDWSKIGTSVADMVNSAVKNLKLEKFAEGVSSLVKGLLTSIENFITKTDWSSVGSKITNAVCKIDWAGVAGKIVKTIINAFFGLVDLVIGCGKALGENIGEGLKVGVKGIFKGIFDWLNENIFQPIWNGIKKLFGIHSPSTKMAELGGYMGQGLLNGFTNWIKPIIDKCKELWNKIKSVFTGVGSWFSSTFSGAWEKVKGAFKKDVVKAYFGNVYGNIKSAFGGIATWFKTTFKDAWSKVKEVFSKAGRIFVDIKDGVLNGLKSVINGLIGGINKVIKIPFDGLNKALRGIHDVDILGIKPFSFIGEIGVPQIPKLATGTVVPANYGNFMAILGDNKREPEVVSPLSTMRQAVKEAILELGGTGGDINLSLELNMDGQKVYSTVRKINRENQKAGKESFALA